MDASEKRGSAVELMKCLCRKAWTFGKELKTELVEGRGHNRTTGLQEKVYVEFVPGSGRDVINDDVDTTTMATGVVDNGHGPRRLSSIGPHFIFNGAINCVGKSMYGPYIVNNIETRDDLHCRRSY